VSAALEDLIRAARITAEMYPYEGRLVAKALKKLEEEHTKIVEKILSIPVRSD
jgi:hypothetical protein